MPNPSEPESRRTPLSELRQSFKRQRRSLIAVSLVLLLYLTAGLQLEELKVLGNTFKLKSPELIPISLWVVWLYFAIRYYQLLVDLNDPEPREALFRYYDRWAIRRAELHPNGREVHPNSLDSSEQLPENYDWSFSAPSVNDRRWPTWTIQFYAFGTTKEGIFAGAPNTSATAHQAVRIGKSEIVRAVASVGLHTRFFTEYGLPIVVAILPLVAGIVVWLR